MLLGIPCWNFPLNLCVVPLAGAIAAGCTSILKPSEVSPAVAEKLAELIPKYLDSSCYQVVLGAVPETTKLLENKFDLIFFTGPSYTNQKHFSDHKQIKVFMSAYKSNYRSANNWQDCCKCCCQVSNTMCFGIRW